MKVVKATRARDFGSSLTSSAGTITFDGNGNGFAEDEVAEVFAAQGKVEILGDFAAQETKSPATKAAEQLEGTQKQEKEEEKEEDTSGEDTSSEEKEEEETEEKGSEDVSKDEGGESTDATEQKEEQKELSEEEKTALREILQGYDRDALKTLLKDNNVEFKGNGSNESFIDLIIENNLV